MPVMPSWWTSAAVIADAERDAGDDGGLGAGVVALDVGGGIGLGEPERLGLGQRVGVRGARLRHPGEDVVGGAVDDAHHPGDALPHQRLAERPDDRDAARDGGLEEQVDPGALGGLEELGAVLGEQLLVAGDDRLAGLEGGEDEVAGGLDAADELDDEVDVGIVDDRAGVVGEPVARRARWAGAWRGRAPRCGSPRGAGRCGRRWWPAVRRSARRAARRRCRTPAHPPGRQSSGDIVGARPQPASTGFRAGRGGGGRRRSPAARPRAPGPRCTNTTAGRSTLL